MALKGRTLGRSRTPSRRRTRPTLAASESAATLLGRRFSGLRADNGQKQRLRLEIEDEHRDRETEGRPDPDRVPAAVGPDPQSGEQCSLGRVVGEDVEVDALDRRRASPPRHLPVAAVEQELELDQQHGPEGGEEAGETQRERGQQPDRQHEGGDRVRAERRRDQRSRDVHRHPAHVEPSRPVLVRRAVEVALRLDDRAELSDRRQRRTRGLGR